MQENKELLSISDFFIAIYKRKALFIGVWLLVMALTIAYLAVAKKSWRLTGTIYVGRFQRLLVEEGEFVANKLEDYSFIKRAMDRSGVELDISINRLQRLIEAGVINEIKKTEDVGLVKLTVEYKDQQKCYEIFKALTDQLIQEHGVMVQQSVAIFDEMEKRFWDGEKALRATLENDEAYVSMAQENPGSLTVPSQLLAQHTVSEKMQYLQTLIKDIHYLKIEGHSATRSFNTRLAAEPEIPDEHYKPKTVLVLLLGAIVATIAATFVSLGLTIYTEQIKPKLT